MIAYKFLRSDHRSGSGDEPAWAIGEKRAVLGPLDLCKNGYHYSRSAIDALRYAPGSVLAHVEVGEERIDGADKGCAREMTAVSLRDVSRALREFACDCAERALQRRTVAGRATECGWSAVRVARAYARGEATIDELKQAQGADDIASVVAADDAAYAAYAAAYDAACDAYSASYAAAAYAAAYSADYDAAYAVERAWQRAHLADLLRLDDNTN